MISAFVPGYFLMFAGISIAVLGADSKLADATDPVGEIGLVPNVDNVAIRVNDSICIQFQPISRTIQYYSGVRFHAELIGCRGENSGSYFNLVVPDCTIDDHITSVRMILTEILLEKQAILCRFNF